MSDIDHDAIDRRPLSLDAIRSMTDIELTDVVSYHAQHIIRVRAEMELDKRIQRRPTARRIRP